MTAAVTACSPRNWALGAALVALAGCSTLSEQVPQEECASDEDCADGTVCDPVQLRCVDATEAPPRANLAFDLTEREAGEELFRAELVGCDFEVQPSGEGLRELKVTRREVSQSFFLQVLDRDPADPTQPTADEVLAGRFELTQATRLARAPTTLRRSVVYDLPEEDMETDPTPLNLGWPRYHPFDLGTPPEYVVWETFPDGELAPIYQMIPQLDLGPCETSSDCCEGEGCDPSPNFCQGASGTCTAIGNASFSYRFIYEPLCNRTLTGTVALYLPEQGMVGGGLAGASVRVRYADVPGQPPLAVSAIVDVPLSERPPQCERDDDCGEGRVCDTASQQCFLALAGRTANREATTDDSGTFATQVYSYCEALPGAGNLQRAYRVTVTPQNGLPSVSYDLPVTYAPPIGGSNDPTPIDDTLCVPFWGDTVQLQLPLQGAPATLASGGPAGDYTCCDVGCLPARGEDVVGGPPLVPVACGGSTSAGATPTVKLETPLTITEAERLAWLQADCVAPVAGSVIGSLRRDADCPPDGGPCIAEALGSGTEEEPRPYSVRIESPAGSVLASRDVQLDVAAGATAFEQVTLPPRTIVMGTVAIGASLCALRDDPSDCASRGAVVIAERLRMAGETTATVPGPYLHQVSTYFDPAAGRDGAFALPLDPGGVYVVTALPAPGEEGGPAGFALVDLRAEAPAVEPLKFVLAEGVLVRLDLRSFARQTFVVPIDTGSFLDEGKTLVHPTADRLVDLNRIDECLTPDAEGPQACKIRQLVVQGANTSVSQVGEARFTARRASNGACSGQ